MFLHLQCCKKLLEGFTKCHDIYAYYAVLCIMLKKLNQPNVPKKKNVWYLKSGKNPKEFGLCHKTLSFEEKVSKLKEKNVGDSQNF
jgi:hypothetical protein